MILLTTTASKITTIFETSALSKIVKLSSEASSLFGEEFRSTISNLEKTQNESLEQYNVFPKIYIFELQLIYIIKIMVDGLKLENVFLRQEITTLKKTSYFPLKER